jgi:hypothetical protein
MDDPIQALRDRIAAAQRQRLRAEHTRDAATAAAHTAAQTLRDEFGVETAEQAKTCLAELRRSLADELATITAALDEIGA